jgi:3D-(3,5/4)-trihydroxycyclohexane-1,2-dione acylhydrolase (decyclizing)
VKLTIETDPLALAPDSESWWDVPVAEVSEIESVRQARAAYDAALSRQRRYL